MPLDGGVQLVHFVVAQIKHVEHRPQRKKHEAGEDLALLGRELELAQRMFAFDRRAAAHERRLLVLAGGVFLALEVFLQPLQAALDLFEIGEHQLEIERLRISQGIDAARGVRHGGIVEDAQHVRERVHLAQRRQHRGIARRFSFCGAHDAPDVDVLDGGIGHLFRLIERGQLIDARLRHARHAHMRGAARRLFVQMSPRENAEESCFAGLRQTHDSRLHEPQIVAQPAPLPALRYVLVVGCLKRQRFGRLVTEMGKHAAVVLYGVAMAAIIVGVDFAFFRNRFWGTALTVNIGIVAGVPELSAQIPQASMNKAR